MNLKQYFDRVVVINLKRRPERLIRLHRTLRKCNWPFKWPEIFVAIDGRATSMPKKFKSGPGAWGCNCSHRQVMEDAIRDRVDSLLILEDDVCFAEGFRERVEAFLKVVPGDWDGLMIGGQHRYEIMPPNRLKSGIYRCVDCERTHCYALRGKYLRKLCQRLKGGGVFNGRCFNDHIMGRDPELQLAHKVYAPELFLAGQERTQSDISKAILPRKFWNPPGPELAVINLHAQAALMAVLREYGWHTGTQLDPTTGIEKNLAWVFDGKRHSEAVLRARLRHWLKHMQWEVAGDPDFICTIWHPWAHPELVRKASLWPIYEVTANTVKEAMRQVPLRMRRPRALD